MSASTGIESHSIENKLRKRASNEDAVITNNIDIGKHSNETYVKTKMYMGKRFDLRGITSIASPALFTILSFYLRFKNIDKNNHVVWDEAHFGKFGSYYITHEFYHDVHPPLGKMLVALSEYLAGFDGHFSFDSNTKYPSEMNFKFMRQFNATFGALCVPLTFFTAKNLGFSWQTTYLVTLMVTLEHSYITLSKFILLDSILLFFTLTTFACLVKIYTLRKKQLTRKWSLWMLLTGISVGCVCSVKWVGLFITIVVGIYTLMDLFSLHHDENLSRVKYYKHWLIRIIDLIIIPFLIYMFCFKIHFALLYKSGTGDASTNTLFQINLENTKIEIGPRNVAFGSEVTIRSHGLSPNLLHSHVQLYPDGSKQRQVTGYAHSDANNNWEFHFADHNYSPNDTIIRDVMDGMDIRLVHKNTRNNLHSHKIPSHVSRGNFEVSGYGNDDDFVDSNDIWTIELVDQLDSSNPNYPKEDPTILHPVSTFFRLRHKKLGCYLASTGLTYPQWGFQQAEIVCKNSWSKRDKATWWNVEDHWNSRLTVAEEYLPPKSKFWTDFVLINFAMASSNSALIPDQDKFDPLASEPWEWPTLHKGLRMCSWSRDSYRYYLMGSPFNTWISTLSLFGFVLLMLRIIFKWGRQTINLTEDQIWKLLITGVFPFFSWIMHFLPFVMMGRVTYVHHYVPALYFAILVFGFVIEQLFVSAHPIIKYPAFIILATGCIWVYIIFAPICQGLHGPLTQYLRLQWLPSWDIII
ncbi:dolichyl-phosphate-mannose-protein mannosyltransferase PMT6 NDAI_0D02240 [Naumovozyma dairenensis CBS 421]|uniref:Dolichyl-phosphate-mannose--protein mannosyltransferase n=1 Tax=Naumovozyma dairenensis (strain ATCC 10597 / BCRC 20456 / CBS 421 / NBRC 0211 / NRRL Y-12639) TaxID=1071378 RepID=G0W9S7_NAUDC|nr:hypothetical protein NDAI_0D02240 [Naumovozyma dairenensis CBS 421]CCD24538.1 hypothetical protein NDAI_0D02240 [Naumovozyma dairenensis CBS 421]